MFGQDLLPAELDRADAHVDKLVWQRKCSIQQLICCHLGGIAYSESFASGRVHEYLTRDINGRWVKRELERIANASQFNHVR